MRCRLRPTAGPIRQSRLPAALRRAAGLRL